MTTRFTVICTGNHCAPDTPSSRWDDAVAIARGSRATTMPSSGISRLAAKRAPRERARRLIESCWFEVSGLEIHAHVGGKGTPVVLVHGYGVSGCYMLPLAQSLVPSFSVFAPDLPGYGR